jgi:hypothetical protein
MIFGLSERFLPTPALMTEEEANASLRGQEEAARKAEATEKARMMWYLTEGVLGE